MGKAFSGELSCKGTSLVQDRVTGYDNTQKVTKLKFRFDHFKQFCDEQFFYIMHKYALYT